MRNIRRLIGLAFMVSERRFLVPGFKSLDRFDIMDLSNKGVASASGLSCGIRDFPVAEMASPCRYARYHCFGSQKSKQDLLCPV